MTRAIFELRKFVEALFTPLIFSVVLISVGLLRRRRAVILAGLLLLLIPSIPAVSNSLCSLLENQYPHLKPEQCPQADAVVALGGFAGEKKQFPGDIEWYDAVDRFESAVKLVRIQKAPILLLADFKPWPDDSHTAGNLLRQAAVEHGLSPEAIRIARTASTTADEAEAIKEYLQQNGGRRIILVTSALHMSRAAFLFRRAGIECIPFPVDYESDGWEWKWDRLIPTPDAMDKTQRCLHEILGGVLYHILPFAGTHPSALR